MSSSNVKVYDIEIFPNYFLAGFIGIEDESPTFFEIYDIDGEQVNEVHSLISFVSDKWLVGFNSRDYDNQIIEYFIRCKDDVIEMPPGILAPELFHLSSSIIEEGEEYHKWSLSFSSIDLKRVGNINKSLKMCGVDLRHHNIQEFDKPFDEPIELNEIEEVKDYNYNDLETTQLLYHELRDDIKMRKELSVRYNTDLMDYADSGMADRLLGKFYSEKTGLSFWDFIGQSTERNSVHLDEIISDKIEFRTDNLNNLLQSVRREHISANDKFEQHVKIGETRYDMLKGGLHSVRPPEIFESTEDIRIFEADVSSYYPRAMTNYRIKPAHLMDAFLDILKNITFTRLEAKKNEDWVTSDGLKITINSVFGKMGYSNSWMYDIKALFGVTINCQLFLLRLIEALNEAGFNTVYGNTDGIFTKVPIHRWDEYERICNWWEEYTGFDLDFEEYNKCVIRNVNNYLVEKADGSLKMKGAFDTERWSDLTKGYKYPVVPYAVKQYFINDVDVRETIQNHQDILDFCISQKVGRKFDVFYNYINDGRFGKEKVQKTNRYYIGKGGGSLVKDSGNKQIQLVSGEPVRLLNQHDKSKSIEEYEVKHRYYIQEAYKIINEFSTKQQTLF